MTTLGARPTLRAMRRLACLALLVLLGACTDRALLQRRAYLASFVGQGEADLVRQLGVPTRTFTLKDETFLAYDDRHSSSFCPASPPARPAWGPWGPGWGWGWSPPIVVARGCESTFDIRGGKVVGLTMRGPDC